MTRLDIFSDPVCPWCMIGKAHLDRALAGSDDHPFFIEWHPFQLNPDMPVAGMDRRVYLEEKFGSKARAAEISARVEEAALAAGIRIDFAAIARIPNTLDAHRLIHWAGLDGRQPAVVAALFAAYWQQGRDIGAAETLAEIAAECGLDAQMIARLLASDADIEAVRARDGHARARGVQAVPTWLIDNRYVVAGAQPAELWTQVLAELRAGAGAMQA